MSITKNVWQAVMLSPGSTTAELVNTYQTLIGQQISQSQMSSALVLLIKRGIVSREKTNKKFRYTSKVTEFKTMNKGYSLVTVEGTARLNLKHKMTVDEVINQFSVTELIELHNKLKPTFFNEKCVREFANKLKKNEDVSEIESTDIRFVKVHSLYNEFVASGKTPESSAKTNAEVWAMLQAVDFWTSAYWTHVAKK